MSSTTIARTQRCATLCANLPFRSSQRRVLSTTIPLRAIKPESPKWIEIPEQIQPPTQAPPPIKGILPVPRQILPRRRQYKATPEFLLAATQEPKRKLQRSRYKDRMAQMRRNNMREGVSELYTRVIETEDQQERKKEHEILDQLKSQYAAERHDEKWTRVSVSKAVRDALARKDNSRIETEEERQARKARYETVAKARRDERLESIHSLYLHARDFILTEERLEQELEKNFGKDDLPAHWLGSHRSVWSAGTPPGVDELAGRMPLMSSDSLRGKNYEQMSSIMRQRLMKIAGKLTGGVIPKSEDLEKKLGESAEFRRMMSFKN